MIEARSRWFAKAALIVVGITALRLVVLGISKADVFVDEAQYWLWGQNLSFGYYSKPPLVAWVIRATTELGGEDSAFWIRVSAPFFHGATALVLGAFAARVFGQRAALWVAISYLTLPIVSLGSLVISTDTIMAPFFAAGILFYFKLLADNRATNALLSGAMIGLAFMAKYAGIYFFLGAGLAAAFVPYCRPSWKNASILLAAFLFLISPNLIWNLGHDLTTVDHTVDNIGWLRAGGQGAVLNVTSFLEFFSAQVIVIGPVLFVALLSSCWRPDRNMLSLLLFSLPIIGLVCIQALLKEAYGNWAFAAYLAGTIAAVVWLTRRKIVWLWVSLAVNGALAIAVPAVAVFGDEILVDGRPILLRNIGRNEMSEEILALAHQVRPSAIVASDRDILADLFLTGRNEGIPIRAVPAKGRAQNYYEQNFPLAAAPEETILYIAEVVPPQCTGLDIQPPIDFDTRGTAYERMTLKAHVLLAGCLY